METEPCCCSVIEKIDLNTLVLLLNHLGYGKNSEVYRQLYRDMGYSLYGYWEIFYWEVNNPDANEYHPTKIVPKTVNIWKWWKTQNFQMEDGEQEYKMLYEVDLPKILEAFTNDFINKKI